MEFKIISLLEYSLLNWDDFEELFRNSFRKIQYSLEIYTKDYELDRKIWGKENFINNQNNGTDDTSPTFKAFEEGAETLSKEQNAILASRQEKFLRDLKHALIRIENKTYGVCRVTGKLIPKERLQAVPHATLSIEAKNMQR